MLLINFLFYGLGSHVNELVFSCAGLGTLVRIKRSFLGVKILNAGNVFELFPEGRDHIADSQNTPAILRDTEAHTHTRQKWLSFIKIAGSVILDTCLTWE